MNSGELWRIRSGHCPEPFHTSHKGGAYLECASCMLCLSACVMERERQMHQSQSSTFLQPQRSQNIVIRKGLDDLFFKCFFLITEIQNVPSVWFGSYISGTLTVYPSYNFVDKGIIKTKYFLITVLA